MRDTFVWFLIFQPLVAFLDTKHDCFEITSLFVKCSIMFVKSSKSNHLCENNHFLKKLH